MPNYCDYEMKVVGKPASIKEFISVIQADYDYATNVFTGPRHMYRVFEAHVVQEPDMEELDENGNAECIISGYCAWSVAACMLDIGYGSYYSDVRRDQSFGTSPDVKRRDTHLLLESENLGLDIEVFSKEPGMCFQEHYLIKNGELTVNETHEYNLVYWDKDEYPTIEEFNEDNGTDYLETDFDEDGFFEVGGIEWAYEI